MTSSSIQRCRGTKLGPVLAWLRWGLTALCCIPAATFVAEVLVGAPPPRRRAPPSRGHLPRTVILVPAHNEQAVITATLDNLQGELSEQVSLLVVADNCEDDTPALAERAGARVVRRTDPTRRGKGYAIEFGLNELAKDPPEIVIVVDADCRVDPGSIAILAERARETGRPVQAEYLILPPRLEPRTAVNALAFLIKNRVRPLGLARLGLPCQLTGSGMAFPWDVIRKAPPGGAYLVEDMLMGIELARLGYPPLFCPEARIKSELPSRAQAQAGQRRRWEHGHIATLIDHGPKLLVEGVRRGDPNLVALGLDLLVPPLTLLLFGLCVMLGLNALLSLGFGVGLGAGPLYLSLGAVAAVGASVLLAWLTQGRELVPLRYAFLVPGYMLWKLPLYVAFAARRKQATWEQTERT
jgi:cellulose synthase/poly-beta-1,6-N-acetylglucosamine synthase-like glycosyltransferase